MANRENLPEWSSPILEVRKQTQGPLTEEGARYTTVTKFLGRRFETPFEVTVHDPPRRHTDRTHRQEPGRTVPAGVHAHL